MHRIHVASTEYLRIPVTTTVSGAVINPTSLAVSIALVRAPDPLPASPTWLTGSWETDTVNGVVTYYARVLVNAAAFTAGEYRPFVKIVDSPETPVLEADAIEFFD